jgi:hypothetical protein
MNVFVCLCVCTVELIENANALGVTTTDEALISMQGH